MATIYILYPDLDDDTEFHVTTSLSAAITYFEVLGEDWTYEALLRVGHIVKRQPVESVYPSECFSDKEEK